MYVHLGFNVYMLFAYTHLRINYRIPKMFLDYVCKYIYIYILKYVCNKYTHKTKYVYSYNPGTIGMHIYIYVTISTCKCICKNSSKHLYVYIHIDAYLFGYIVIAVCVGWAVL